LRYAPEARHIGHFFVDKFPDDIARTLSDFLTSIAAT
jgi:hypothetical protein